MKKKFPEDLVTHSKQRALQYQHVDGTFELTFGVSTLLMAICFYMVNRIAASNDLLAFAPLVVFVGAVYLMDALVKCFRMRVTYSRTGYIAYQKPRTIKRALRLMIWIGVPMLTAILLALLFLNRASFQPMNQEFLPFMTLFFGLVFTGLWLIIAWITATPRFMLISLICSGVGVWLLLNGASVTTSLIGLFGGMGLALCVTGSLALRHYLSQNRAPQEPNGEQ